jgi:hypothetical protein
MNRGDRDTAISENDLPLGSDPRRSWTPVFVLTAVYLAWFGFLLWLATTQVGWK